MDLPLLKTGSSIGADYSKSPFLWQGHDNDCSAVSYSSRKFMINYCIAMSVQHQRDQVMARDKGLPLLR